MTAFFCISLSFAYVFKYQMLKSVSKELRHLNPWETYWFWVPATHLGSHVVRRSLLCSDDKPLHQKSERWALIFSFVLILQITIEHDKIYAEISHVPMINQNAGALQYLVGSVMKLLTAKSKLSPERY